MDLKTRLVLVGFFLILACSSIGQGLIIDSTGKNELILLLLVKTFDLIGVLCCNFQFEIKRLFGMLREFCVSPIQRICVPSGSDQTHTLHLCSCLQCHTILIGRYSGWPVVLLSTVQHHLLTDYRQF